MGWTRSRCRLQRGPASSLSHWGMANYLCLKDEASAAAEGESLLGWTTTTVDTQGKRRRNHPSMQNRSLVAGTSPASYLNLQNFRVYVSIKLRNAKLTFTWRGD
jgi:hypothetical protein